MTADMARVIDQCRLVTMRTTEKITGMGPSLAIRSLRGDALPNLLATSSFGRWTAFGAPDAVALLAIVCDGVNDDHHK
jgi:hypothetical protein